MLYTAGQILVWLFLAALLGFVMAWLLQTVRHHRLREELHAELAAQLAPRRPASVTLPRPRPDGSERWTGHAPAPQRLTEADAEVGAELRRLQLQIDRQEDALRARAEAAVVKDRALAQLAKELAEAHDAHDALTAQLTTLGHQLSSSGDTHRDQNDSLTQLALELRVAEESQAARELRIEELEAEVRRLRASARSIDGTLTAVRTEFDDVTDVHHHVGSRLDALRNTLTTTAPPPPAGSVAYVAPVASPHDHRDDLDDEDDLDDRFDADSIDELDTDGLDGGGDERDGSGPWE